ncbi:Cof-type HAD-IIB family hydrolase [Oceanobacillus jeddahense]|uniref:Cof-type HAD-IIB family hydrolase n=1 Tax=Oceanobacillus jeddahense TaxID=1462527 RepID=UPI000595C5F3|nr:Cof-type HAD-IIB family hydrolase [Oceanobacillus jeddahense]
MEKRIVFFDIDGTILDRNNEIPKSTIDSIHEIQSKGIEVAISTGRAPTMFQHISEELSINSYVSCNGSLVVYQGEVIHQEKYNIEDLRELEKKAFERGYSMMFSTKDKIWINSKSDVFIDDSMSLIGLDVPTYHEATLHDEISYALLLCETDDERFLEQYRNNFRFLRWYKYCVDVLNPDMYKAKGALKMLEYLEIPKESSVAFGDGINDLELLKFVGTGVAMGNSVESAKQASDFVTRDVADNGIAYGLKKLGLIDKTKQA